MSAEGSGVGELAKDDLLRSWKEISAYLGCDIRTCHRWEDQRGMPVHRAEGTETRSPVFAYKSELDAWFGGTFKSSNHVREKAPAARSWLKWAAGAVVLLAVVGGASLLLGRRARPQPADFAIQGQFLVILDQKKKELWRYDTGLENLAPESYFRDHYQVTSLDTGNPLPSLIIKDIDRDGDAEVLFSPRRSTELAGFGLLVCLDRKGTEIWRFESGREVKCGGQVFPADYRMPGFVCHDVNGDGRFETLVFAIHKPEWPCQLALLDSGGRPIGEFWNAGHLTFPLFQDLDGDGREELLVFGVNNEYRGGCLAVFDTRRISGSSPQTGPWVFEGLEPGSELYYVTLPYTDVSRAMGHFVEGMTYAFVTENDWINASYGPSLLYEFDFGLKCVQVSWGHGYMKNHEKGVKEGTITSALDPDYGRTLIAGIRYWNGAAMVPEVSMNRR
jgi:hypothetical protein